jgi:hypothetical protein
VVSLFWRLERFLGRHLFHGESPGTGKRDRCRVLGAEPATRLGWHGRARLNRAARERWRVGPAVARTNPGMFA